MNYPGLRYLLQKYEGFQVVCVPCNQFGGQAPGTSDEERAIAREKFNYPVTVVDKLLESKADPVVVNVYARSALDNAAHMGRV